MIRTALIAATLFATAVPVWSDEKAETCGLQSQVVAAIQQARLDRVKERDVPKAIAATNPTWPENYNNAIPFITPWVYEQKMRDIRTKDLSAVWNDVCMTQ